MAGMRGNPPQELTEEQPYVVEGITELNHGNETTEATATSTSTELPPGEYWIKGIGNDSNPTEYWYFYLMNEFEFWGKYNSPTLTIKVVDNRKGESSFYEYETPPREVVRIET